MGEEWVVKYRPKKSTEVKGQEKAVSELKAFIQNFSKGMKPLLLAGTPGTGKTSSVYAVASEMNLEVVEVNASDVRNKGSIEEVVGGAIGQMSLFAKGKLILLDEIDGLSGTKDRGGIPAIVKLMEKSSFPVVMTANDPYAQKFSSLRKKCRVIEFMALDYNDIYSKLKEICALEKIKYEDDALKSLARKAGGDMRGAINDLQTLASDKTLKKEDLEILGDREKKDNISNALMKVFKTTHADIALKAYDDVDVNLDEIFLWVEQNISLEYKKPLDLQRAFDALSLANVFYGRIRKWQHYRFYVYCYALLSAGIALAKDEKYPGIVTYKRSTKPLKIWMTNNKLAKKKSIASKLADVTHTSTRVAMQNVPYFLAAKRNKDFLDSFSECLELDDAEMEWIMK